MEYKIESTKCSTRYKIHCQ